MSVSSQQTSLFSFTFKIIRLLGEIMLLRKGPSDLPYSKFLCGLLALLFGLLYSQALSSAVPPSNETVIESSVFMYWAGTYVLCLLIFWGAVLSTKQKFNRFIQFSSAWFGVEVLFELVNALAWSLVLYSQIFALVPIVMLAWRFAVSTTLVQRTLEVKLVWAFFLVIAARMFASLYLLSELMQYIGPQQV